MLSVPPARLTRSCIPARPSLAAVSGSKPPPSSCTSISSSPSASPTVDAHLVRAGVLGDVRERLLHQPVDGGLELLDRGVRRLPGSGSASSPSISKPALLAVAVEQRLDRRPQPELVERGRAQLGDDRAQVLDLALDVLHRLAHRLLGPLEIIAAQR